MLHLKNTIGVGGPGWSLKQTGLKLGFTKAQHFKLYKQKFVQKNYMLHKNCYAQLKEKKSVCYKGEKYANLHIILISL